MYCVASNSLGGFAECACVGFALKAEDVCAEQPLDDASAPGKLSEEPCRRKRDVQKEGDDQVGALLAQHLGHELQLVVVHPDERAGCGDLSDALGKPAVDLAVALPPLAVILGWGNDIVIQRPEGAVCETLVVQLDVFTAQRHGNQPHRTEFERLDRFVGIACPPHPHAAQFFDHGPNRRDEPSR